MRARLRAQVLPALTAINSAAVVNVARFAARARRDEDFLSRLARSRRRRAEPSSLVGLISADPHKAPGLPEQAAPLAVTLAKGALGSRVLRLWLAEQGVRADSRELDRLLALRREGASIVVEGRCVMLSRGCYWVTRGRPYEIELSPPGRAELPGLPLAIVSRFTEAGAFDVQRACSATRVAFDADRLHLSVWVRSVRCGDRVRPFGLQGSAKVGNLFTNAKIPQPLREHWPVLAHGDEIAWVVGLRRGDLAPVTATTRRLLVLELEGMVP
jgi:tRNA(Ile)-lysidine synthetase-like protein